MRLAYIGFSLLFLMAIACTKQSNTIAPQSIAGMTLNGKLTSGSGAFATMAGYQFATHFSDQSRFQTKNLQGAIESDGEYTYKILDDHTALLKLRATSPNHANEELQITLKFTAPNSGVYEGKLFSGGAGEQTGVFDMK